MFRKFLCFISVFIISTSSLIASPLPDISADGAILIDAKTNTIIYSKNMSQPFYPASTTKILTSLVILNDLALDETITKTQDAIDNVPTDSSQIGLNVGDQYSVFDGLHAVLMASDNFVCYDLAKKDAGTITNFAQKMNTFALTSGANNFNFVNPHGYHDPNHYTTPYSLAKIAQLAFTNPVLTKIAGTHEYKFTVLNTNKTIDLTHTAALLDPNSPYYNKHVVAAKTGFHNEAGRTLVAKAVYGNLELIGVVMRTNAPHQFEDMNALFKYGATNFKLVSTQGTETKDNNTSTNDDNKNTSMPNVNASPHLDANQNPLYILANKTYSLWAKSYVEEALANGWITNTTHNYLTPVTKREFLCLLRCISPSKYDDTVDQMLQHNGVSIYTENLPSTKEEIAQVIYTYLQQFNLTLLSNNINITDLNTANPSKREAIQFCVDANIISTTNGKFSPTNSLTYEQALCIISKLNGIITRYNSYNL